MNYHSTKNQEILGKFVNRDVHTNVNTMVEYILSKGYEDSEAPFTWEDVENYYEYPEYTGKHISFYTGQEEDYQEAKNELQEQIDDLYNIEDRTEEQEQILLEMEEEMQEFSELETQPQDIFEWWLCDSYLIEKLAELGEPVIRDENIWGRTCTGQAIAMDYVIAKICENMEILEGQQYEW